MKRERQIDREIKRESDRKKETEADRQRHGLTMMILLPLLSEFLDYWCAPPLLYF